MKTHSGTKVGMTPYGTSLQVVRTIRKTIISQGGSSTDRAVRIDQ